MPEGRQILMAMFQGGGNIPLLLPIVARLVTRGHRVRVLLGPGVRRSRLPVSESLVRSLHATGAQILRLREPEVHPWDAAPSAQGLLWGWTPQAFRSLAQEARAQLWLPHWAHEVAAALRRAPADVLVAGFVLVGALVAAEAVGVPAVVLFHNVYPRPVPGRPPYGPGWAPGVGLLGRLRDATGTVITHRLYARAALPALNQARTNLGLHPLHEYFTQYDRAARVVARGAGLRVPADVPPERLREAIQRVVTDPSFRQAAQQLATRMAGEDPVQAAVDEIGAVTEQRPERVAG